MDHVRITRVGPSGTGALRKWAMQATIVPTLLRLNKDYDDIIVCGFRVLGLPAIIAAKLLGKTCYLKADVLGELSGEVFRRGADGGAARNAILSRVLSLRARILRAATAFVAVSSPVEEELQASGIPAGRIVRIPNSVDTELFRPVDVNTKRSLRERLNIPLDRKVVTYTGRLETTKGLPVLLAAWRSFVANQTDALLLLVGEGGLGSNNCERQLHAFVHDHKLGDRVLFTGAVHNVHEYLQASDAFVFPSEREAFGISVAEAMACSLPVLSTAAGGLRDLVCNGQTALVVPVGDADALVAGMIRVLSEGLDELRTRARAAVVERYGQASVFARYQALLTARQSDGRPL